jgi:hypothetical protein
VEVLPLRHLKRSNTLEMKKLFQLLHKLPQTVHWYLVEFVFPSHMRHQRTKFRYARSVSACVCVCMCACECVLSYT